METQQGAVLLQQCICYDTAVLLCNWDVEHIFELTQRPLIQCRRANDRTTCKAYTTNPFSMPFLEHGASNTESAHRKYMTALPY